MSEYDLHNNVDDRVALRPVTISGPGTSAGEIIDTSGFESIEYIVQSGTISNGTHTVLLEEGDDAGLSDAATLSADDTLGVLPVFIDTSDDLTIRVGSIGKKRYQRISIVSTGAGGLLSAIAILGHPHTAPV